MTKQDIQDYKDKRNLDKGFNAYWNKGFDEAIALLNSDEPAINYTRCCMDKINLDVLSDNPKVVEMLKQKIELEKKIQDLDEFALVLLELQILAIE
jgi:hypothetical protein